MRAVNLIPAEQREGSGSLIGRSQGAALAVLVLIAGLAVLAVMYGKARHTESASHAELTTITAELTAAHAQVGRMAPYTTFISMANQRVQTFSGLVAARFDWSHAFNELGRVLPSDAALTSLHGQVGGSAAGGSSTPAAPAASATPMSATPPGSTPVFTITGCATGQSEVAQTLERLRLIDGVSDVTLQSSAKQSAPGGAGAGGSGANGGACGPHGANFSAQITFTALPSPPPTNAPGGAPGAGASGSVQGAGAAGAAGAGSPAGAAPAGSGAVTVSSQGTGR